MSKKDDTGLSWDLKLPELDLSGLGNWEIDLSPHSKNLSEGFPELSISHEELQAGYNDRQEEAGRMAWAALEARAKAREKAEKEVKRK